MKKTFVLIFVLAVVLSLLGCAPQATPTSQPATLKVVALPILDTMPVLVAQQQGLFSKYNLTVEFIPAGSAPERDQLVAAGQADGMLNEVLSALYFNKESARVQVVRYARAATPDAALFTLVANPNSGVKSVADLKGKSVGISEGTIIQYVTERLLMAEGVNPQEVKLTSVPKIDARLALVKSGELDAAVLPEPLASVAVKEGSVAIISDAAHPQYSFSTWTFRNEVLKDNPDAVKRFLLALEEAVALINAEPAKPEWKQLLVDNKILPAPLAETFVVPPFVTAGVPTEEQFMDTLSWAKEKGFLQADQAYQDVINGSFLPQK